MTANVRLLREVPPACPDPYSRPDGTLIRPEWDSTSQLTNTGDVVKMIIILSLLSFNNVFI